jgi:BirA family biotin operon repressor/biotin-[acetyl-CoA-carboxylase] ligase
MVEPTDSLTESQLRAALAHHPFVSAVAYFSRIGSTNDWAKAQATTGAAEGLLVVADEQTAGRGRLGRQWWSPAGAALLTTLLFRPVNCPPHHVQQLAMLCALAAADAVTAQTGLSVDLKWPNDLTIGERKLAGLLAEAAFCADRLDFVVVGMGMNVNTDFAAAPSFIAPAASLRQELGRGVDRLALLIAYLDRVARRYWRFRAGDSPLDEWTARLATLNRPVTARLVGEKSALTGRAEGVDPDGALLLRTADGAVHRLLAADVSLRTNGDG